MSDPLACYRGPSEVQCGVSGKKLTEGAKIAGCQHILTGLIIVISVDFSCKLAGPIELYILP